MIAFWILALGLGTQAGPQLPNCTIWIHTWNPHGVPKEKVLYTRSSSKRTCRQLASLHRPVFNRRGKVRQKKIRYRFAEVPWGRQNFPSWD